MDVRGLFVLCQKLFPPPDNFMEFNYFFYTNREIFGRELWLCCYLVSRRFRLMELWEAWATLAFKVTEVSALARQLAEAHGQWGRELWLCCWMVGLIEAIRTEQYALIALQSVGLAKR